MAVREIVLYGDERLRQESKLLDEITEADQILIDDMIETMLRAPGVGLAAVQVGQMKRILVFVENAASDEEKSARALINPEITEYSKETWVMEEGCLSVPDVNEDVRRAKFVKVEALDREGNTVVIEGDEMVSRILQHEIDHLDGTLFIDRLRPLKERLVKKRLKKRLLQGA